MTAEIFPRLSEPGGDRAADLPFVRIVDVWKRRGANLVL